MKHPLCPNCKFVTHPTHNDENTITYICERCGTIFKVKK